MSILESFGWFHNLAHYSPDRREFILKSEHYAEYLLVSETIDEGVGDGPEGDGDVGGYSQVGGDLVLQLRVT